MKNLALLLFVSLWLFGCTNSSVEMPKDFTYTVAIGEHPVNNAVTVKINRRLSLDQLKHLGNEVLKTLPSKPRTFIAYLLPGMKEGEGAWAVTNFTPDLEAKIFGTTELEFNDKERRTKELAKNAIGVWQGVEPDKYNLALIDSAGLHLFKTIFADGVIIDTVNVKLLDGETFIYLKNRNGKEHYKINLLDQLVYFDDLGKPYQTYEFIK